MLFKIKTHGVEGEFLLLVKNYQQNCKQKVVLNGQTSEWRKINSGVPLRLVLGLILFLIYINNLPDVITSICKIFADDTSLFSKVRDINKSANELNCNLEKVSNWVYHWKIQFNPDPNKKQVKLSSFENLTQTVFPIYLLDSMRIILLNALIKNI